MGQINGHECSPDPLSNIRPILYASKPPTRPSANSPYSASEFPSSSGDAKLDNMELEWRLRRERVDLTNHRFWVRSRPVAKIEWVRDEN